MRSTARENNERADQAVREYCQSLTLLCDFKYVSSAVILEPDEESVRYFLVYATHHPRGVEVFKAAEMKAARIQDDVRHETRVRKTGQPDLPFGGGLDANKAVQLAIDACAAQGAGVVCIQGIDGLTLRDVVTSCSESTSCTRSRRTVAREAAFHAGGVIADAAPGALSAATAHSGTGDAPSA